MTAKPRILVLGTGGTIAGAAESSTSAVYAAGKIDAARLVAGVPGLDELAELRAETLYSVPSGDLGPSEWRAVGRRIRDALETGEADGIVVTHGTDTLEEAAFFLDLTCQADKPVVLVGAMRPATALGADGPANLYQAVRVAASEEAAGRGVLVVMNDVVLPGRLAVKTGSLPVQAFRAFPGGPVGRVTGERLTFLETVRRPALAGRFRDALDMSGALPAVGIAYVFGGCGDTPLRACRDAGMRGVVIAGLGAGHMPEPMIDLAREMIEAGTPVVISSRVAEVTVFPEIMDRRGGGHAPIASGFLNPQKAALLLSLALAEGCGAEETAALFALFPAA